MTISKETSDYFKIIETRLVELEKKNGMQEKTISELRVENMEMKERLKKLEQIHGDDSEEMERSKNMSSLSMECVISYMDPNKRILLSFHYREFEKIEKMVPLKLKYLYMDTKIIQINDILYNFDCEQRICSMERYGVFNMIVNAKDLETFRVSARAIRRIIFEFFSGRKHFQVELFRNGISVPYNLEISVKEALIDHDKGHNTEYYTNVVKNVDHLVFAKFRSSFGLEHPWVQGVKMLEMHDGCYADFFSELPNLQNELIHVHFNKEIEYLVPFIIKYCKNRNRKIGSKLFLTTNKLHEDDINVGFNSYRLTFHGFIRVSEELRCLPLDNKSEARVTIREDPHRFDESFLIYKKKYCQNIFLEIVSSNSTL